MLAWSIAAAGRDFLPFTRKTACGVKPGVLLVRAGLSPFPFSDPDAGVPRRSSLERRLDGWGVPYKALLDQVRQARAVELLRTGRHSMTDIALLLGYSENAHFTRAFRRWTGMSLRRFPSH